MSDAGPAAEGLALSEGEEAPPDRTPVGILTSALAIVLTVVAILWALEIQRYLSWSLYPQQYFALALGLGLALAFLMLPAARHTKRGPVPWYDLVFAALGFAACAWIAVKYPDLVNTVFSRPPAAFVPGVVIILLLVEALR